MSNKRRSCHLLIGLVVLTITNVTANAHSDDEDVGSSAVPLYEGKAPPIPNPSPPSQRRSPVRSFGRVHTGTVPPLRSICEEARDARSRNSPAAPNLEAQCRASVVTYNSPMIVAANGQLVLLDFCRDYGSACGQLAADAFCQQKGHPGASRFQISNDVGHTAIISSGTICSEPHCDAFTEIQCSP